MSESLSDKATEGLQDKALESLTRTFGLAGFRPGQDDIIQAVLNGRDTMAVMPTGGGKSLCYQLPAVILPGVTIVVSPLIALMKDQVAALRQKGIAAGCLHSGQDDDSKRDIFAGLSRAPSYLLYLSPERIQKPGFATWFARQKLALIAIDEAHCISQWGADFRQDYHRLGMLREWRPEVPILALTATATPIVLNDIARQLGLRDPSRHVYGFYRKNLFCQVETCTSEEEKLAYISAAVRQYPQGKIIIYCGTRSQCETVTQHLLSIGQKADFYHAGLESSVRTRVQEHFGAGQLRVLAATNAFGMGIDHPDVRLVVHFQMPAALDAYYQEIGRGGRDGLSAHALLLYAKKDKGLHSYFITKAEGDARSIDRRWKSLDAMVQFCEGGECRHSGILTYFRDKQRIDNCGHCDVCDPGGVGLVQPDEVPDRPPVGAGGLRSAIGETRDRGRSDGKKKRAGRSSAKSQIDDQRPLDSRELAIQETLKEWRKQYARSIDAPAFMVMSNRTLEALVRARPRSLSEISQVHGIGPKKLEEFGADLLGVLKKHQG